MKAMILAAGVGSRLGELTKETPKCLVTVGDKTVLERVVGSLKAAGVTEVVINLHHLADKVVSFVESRKHFGSKVHFSREESLLDTGGGLKKAAAFFSAEDTFFVHNADVLSTINLSALAALHRSRGAIGTLAVLRRPSSRGLYLNSAKALVAWTGEGSPAPAGAELFGFCGVSVASSNLFSFMPEEAAFSIIAPYLKAARATKLVWGEPCPEADWIDIGTPEQLAAARSKLPL
jgi:NDP-sugar pyrophosphorylase family protein